MKDENGFSADATNNMNDTRVFKNSGLTAGVQSGLSEVVREARGAIPEQLKSSGNCFRKAATTESAGSKNGKNFEFRN